MCDYEEFIWTCNCSDFRLKSYCHRARNTPGHACTFVKRLRHCWEQGRPCDNCIMRQREREVAEAEAQAQAVAAWYANQGGRS
ncbi:hypothetical protein QBC42DRAFT_304448 [Cladorrhinum samala]|uniref:Uncharacterized protein n=1 Tax=Cladorrhinum samala TaxID=585594 RepID=A0AAV9HV76_9PEZI|nr:hypothetical protein QBC42DRAFT_304448 [Cladorrhinum samala]